MVAAGVESKTLCDIEEEDDAGSRVPVKVLDPKLPSQAEVEEHCLTHLPFRNWCKHCIRGAGRVTDHRSHVRDDGLPEVHLDYCFL